MITNFKIFEGKFTGFKNKSYWVIYGNQKTVVNILEQIILKNNDKKLYFLPKILDALKLKGFKYKGVFLFRQPTSRNISFTTFNNESEKNEIIKRSNLNFKGEIKLENGKIIIDPLEPDINKYNL